MGGDAHIHHRFNSRPRSSHACFNPRPRMGGDRLRTGRGRPSLNVSIHAPAWGATTPPHGALRRVGMGGQVSARGHAPGVSIHAPAWGATAMTKDLSSTSLLRPEGEQQCFNPRPRMGGDVRLRGALRLFLHTNFASLERLPSRECWPADNEEFQSTPPHGGRPNCGA